MGRWRFWALSLLWLPAGAAAMALVRFAADGGPAAEPGRWPGAASMMAGSLVALAPCGLPLALGCRRMWWLGYRRAAWMAGIGLGTVTVAVSLVAGPDGLVAIAFCAVAMGVPVWIAWYRPVRRG